MTKYILQKLQELLNIDSPSGFTKNVTDYTIKELQALGFEPKLTKKGGVLVNLGGAETDNALLLTGHIDTLGAMVSTIKDNGRLILSPVGGMNPNNAETENCRIYTRFDGVYEGCLQVDDPSIHVNGEYNNIKRKFEDMEVVIDAQTYSKEDTQKLGISIGDFVCFEPRFRVTDTGYIKSRFLDDKLSVAIMLGIAKSVSEGSIKLARRTYLHVTVYEEVGHGGTASIPADVSEILAVDMGCVGKGLICTEEMVSICAKDSHGPSNYDMVTKLIELSKENNINYAVDVYPHYGSDVDAALEAGNDIRHCLIGSGVYASHGYERSHVNGLKNTYDLLKAFLSK